MAEHGHFKQQSAACYCASFRQIWALCHHNFIGKHLVGSYLDRKRQSYVSRKDKYGSAWQKHHTFWEVKAMVMMKNV